MTRKYTKRVTEEKPVTVPEGVTEYPESPPMPSLSSFPDNLPKTDTELAEKLSEATRRRSEKPKDAAPEPEQPATALVGNIGALEVSALVQDAIYAHDMQDEIVRFDTMGRKWHFFPNQDKGHTVFTMSCSIPSMTETLDVSNARFGLDGTQDEIKSAVEQLDEVVR